MEMFWGGVFSLGGIQCGLLAAALFLLPLEKRKGWKRALFLGAALGLLAAGGQRLLRGGVMVLRADVPAGWDNAVLVAGAYLELLVTLLTLTALFYACCRIRAWEAVYGGLCAYTAQDLAYILYLLAFPAAANRSTGAPVWETLWLELLLMAAVYAALYFVMATPLAQGGHYLIGTPGPCLSLLAVHVVIITLGALTRDYFVRDGTPFFRFHILYAICLYVSLFVIMLLLNRRMHDRIREEQLLQMQRRQEEQYQAFVRRNELSRHILHDLKYEINAISHLEASPRRDALLGKLREIVSSYDVQLQTGYELLDLLLMEKLAGCRQDGIQYTVHADGQAVAGMEPVELYTLLGNLLDNAIESVRQIGQPDRRFFALDIHRRANMTVIRLENYCDRPPVLEGGLPRSSKADSERHGYGLRSVQAIVERHDGQMQLSAEEGRFVVRVMLQT